MQLSRMASCFRNINPLPHSEKSLLRLIVVHMNYLIIKVLRLTKFIGSCVLTGIYSRLIQDLFKIFLHLESISNCTKGENYTLESVLFI